MAINPDKFRVTDADEITTERWNLAFVEIALALAEVQEKAGTFEAATDQLIATALFRVSETLAPSLEARDLARDWAEKASDTDVVGVGTRSAKHHALAAAVSAGLAVAAQAVTEAARDAAEEAASAAATFDPDIYAAKNSPALTGTPTAPTASTSTNTTQIATTAFVKAVVAALVDSSPAALDTLNELAAALGDDPNFATTITNLIATKANSSHTHAQSDITGLVSALAALQAADADLTALAALSGTGFAVRSAANTWLQRAIAAGTGLTVTNGDGVSGNPTPAIDKASDANVRSGASNKVVTADLIETASAIVTLTDAATVAVDWDAFVSADVVLQGNRTLGDPTNVQPGTCRFILVKGNDGTDRTLSFGSNYKGELPSLTDIDNAKFYLITLWAYTTTHIVVGSVRAL